MEINNSEKDSLYLIFNYRSMKIFISLFFSSVTNTHTNLFMYIGVCIYIKIHIDTPMYVAQPLSFFSSVNRGDIKLRNKNYGFIVHGGLI